MPLPRTEEMCRVASSVGRLLGLAQSVPPDSWADVAVCVTRPSEAVFAVRWREWLHTTDLLCLLVAAGRCSLPSACFLLPLRVETLKYLACAMCGNGMASHRGAAE